MRSSLIGLVLACLLLAVFLFSSVRAWNLAGALQEAPAVERLPRIAPKEPAEALKTFQTLDGFRMELLASEPLVASPVAMVYDEDGRAYVVEMYDYPYTDKTTHQPWKENTTDLPLGR